MKKSLYIIAYCCFSLLEANCNGLSSDVKTNGVGSEALLKEQQSIISEFSEQIQSSEIVSLLNKLTANSIVVTSDSLTSIKENPESALIKLDMYDGANLPIFTRQSLDHILSSEDSSFKKLLGKIENNKKLHTTLTKIQTCYWVRCKNIYSLLKDWQFRLLLLKRKNMKKRSILTRNYYCRKEAQDEKGF